MTSTGTVVGRFENGRVVEAGREWARTVGWVRRSPDQTPGVAETRRDRLRELLDVVLAGAVGPEAGAAGGPVDGRRRLGDMASGAFSSPFHFNRRLSQATGEPPVAMRRRVLLERAAWQLAQGTSVTDAAWAAGYESVEGFSRAFSAAFGRWPSTPPGPGESGWLPAPNGIHFHPPTSLWFRAEEKPMNPLTEQLALHDLDDTRALLEIAKGLADAWSGTGPGTTCSSTPCATRPRAS